MESKILKATILLLVPAISGCVSGWIYTSTVTPYCTDMKNTALTSTSSKSGLKQISIPRVPGARILWSSNTIHDAAKKAGITTVAFCDRKYFKVLGGIWEEDTIIVYGE